jgi:CheY-like chemotaxis protein
MIIIETFARGARHDITRRRQSRSSADDSRARRDRPASRILEDTAEVGLIIVDYEMPGMNGLETIRPAWKRRLNSRRF